MKLPAGETRTALVTGASGSLGGAIALRLAERGDHVILHYHQGQQRASALLSEIQASGGSAELLGFDLRDAEGTKKSLSGTRPVDILIHCAGVARDGLFATMDPIEWREVLSLSLDGFLHVAQPLVLSMILRRYGRIVAMSSVAGLKGNRGQANYAAAKAGLHAAVKSLALEVARKGITVNSIAPGFIDSDMTKSLDADALKQLIPMRRFGSAAEVAEVVEFLSSERASYLTGQCIAVDGGIT